MAVVFGGIGALVWSMRKRVRIAIGRGPSEPDFHIIEPNAEETRGCDVRRSGAGSRCKNRLPTPIPTNPGLTPKTNPADPRRDRHEGSLKVATAALFEGFTLSGRSRPAGRGGGRRSAFLPLHPTPRVAVPESGAARPGDGPTCQPVSVALFRTGCGRLKWRSIRAPIGAPRASGCSGPATGRPSSRW